MASLPHTTAPRAPLAILLAVLIGMAPVAVAVLISAPSAEVAR